MGVNYAGVPFPAVNFKSAVDQDAPDSQGRAEMWWQSNPTPGMHDIVVTFNVTVGGDGAVGGAVSFSGVNTTTPIVQTLTSQDLNATNKPATTITTMKPNAWLVEVVVHDVGSAQQRLTPQQELRWNTVEAASQSLIGGGSTRATTSPMAYTMSWDVIPDDPDRWAQVVAELDPAN